MLSGWMDQEEKFVRVTDFFRTTQSSDVGGPAQQQTTTFPPVPSATAAPSQRPTTVKDLQSPDTVTDGPSEAKEVQLLSLSYRRKSLFTHGLCPTSPPTVTAQSLYSGTHAIFSWRPNPE